MKVIKFSTIVLGLVASVVYAKQSNPNHSVLREISLDSCKFRMKDPYHVGVSIDTRSSSHSASYVVTIDPRAQHPFQTWIRLSCEDPVTSRTLTDIAGMKMSDKGWVLNLTPNDFEEQHTTFYPLRGQGWSGGGVTQDDTDGDETRRTRTFSFCIPHRQLAICGVAQSVGYLKWPNESVLPQVIQILESIEFIDMQSAAPAN
ncbi:hypothetical protein QYH69_10045 [Paraburkholderia sp. SARCC-3016]|uniref:hypothetical protein n=1 Tax=Paraburkholderia sp. SARCC-3016 TaxID=3058611 RepID=UPI00280864C8|nr:hypothetical protein [Paraburkholderia sp. SARCC-3016]MDQ7977578.1 hypothetical protein [Paraburkholderia sp. SARCC-3016]